MTCTRLALVAALAVALFGVAPAAAAPAAPAAPAPPPPAPTPVEATGPTTPVSIVPPAGALQQGAGSAGETRCEKCHVPEGWTPARFNHEETGFALHGQHERASCASCHVGGDFKRALAATCAACHQEPHAQEFGNQCKSCHNETSWSPLFAVDAHRKNAFPLVGRHASLPCTECHFERREIGFTRVTLPCIDCHRTDQVKASQTNIDHIRGNLSPDCRGCHSPVSWRNGFFPEHQLCFPIRTGSHAPIKCAECHLKNALAGIVPVVNKCNQVQAFCIECHTHSLDVEIKNHVGIQGFQFVDNKCIECHRPL